MKQILSVLGRFLPAVPLLFLTSCASVDVNAGMGRQVTTQPGDLACRPESLDTGERFDGISFGLAAAVFDPANPVETDLERIKGIIGGEIARCRGIVAAPPYQTPPDVSIKLVFSKYATRLFTHANYRTFADFDLVFYDHRSSLIQKRTYSIKGQGNDARSANAEALGTIVRAVLLDEALLKYLDGLQRPDTGYRRSLELLAASLIKKFEKSPAGTGAREIRLGLVSNLTFPQVTNILLDCLKQRCDPSRYRFYSRDDLDKLIKEYSIELSGLIDGSAVPKIGKLKDLDYLVINNNTGTNGRIFVEARIIRLADGELLAVETAAINRP